MIPEWLHALSIIALITASICAVIITVDEAFHPQKMWIMNVVWPVNALYFGPVGLWAYFAIGSKSRKDDREGHKENKDTDTKKPKDPVKKAEAKAGKPFWQIVSTGVGHCGAGCTLGDIIAEWIVFLTGWKIAGEALWPEYISDYTAAYILGIIFQFFAVAPMRNLSVGEGIRQAIKADTLSLTAFEVGLFGWMALTAFVFFPHPHLTPTEPAYWFMMQVGMILGFFTAYPVNVWLIKKGIKEAM